MALLANAAIMAEMLSNGLFTEHQALTRSTFVIPPLSMPIPPGTNIDDLRVRLYTLTTPIRFTGPDFTKYWPYITNLWTRQYKGHLDEHGVSLELWHCKNSHATIRPPAIREHRGEGIRNRPFRDLPANCGMKMRIIYYYGEGKSEQDVADWVLMSNDSKGTGIHEHHTLDDLDRAKRCKRFQDICYEKTRQGYSAPAITRWFRRAYAGQDWCKYIGRMDVKNAGQLWRAQNRHIEMKTDVEHDQPEPEEETEGPNWLESTIDEAPQEDIKDILKKLCQELPTIQEKILPSLMKWEPEERSPTPPEEIQGGAFQTPEGDIRIVQPRARRDFVQRAPPRIFVEAPPKILAATPTQQQTYQVEGLTMYQSPSQPLHAAQQAGPSPTSAQYTPIQPRPQPPQNPAGSSVYRYFQYPQAPPKTPQDMGGRMPGRPPNQSKNFSAEPRVLQPAPSKPNQDAQQSIVHVDPTTSKNFPAQSPPSNNVGGEHSQSQLFTARPRWAK